MILSSAQHSFESEEPTFEQHHLLTEQGSRQTYPYCSGTLISPTVFLTAAHCGDDGSTAYVTFNNRLGGPVIGYVDTREYAISTFNAVGPNYLRLSRNPATGNGGTCYGDSSGPKFLGAGPSETDISPTSRSRAMPFASPLT
jgi:hypothetical protein